VRRFTSLVGREVVTEGGRQLGACHDLRGPLAERSLRVTELVVGRRGLLERLGIRRGPRDAVAWDAVVRIGGRKIVVRDGTELL
jgi:sporulation protein YlmC with PRC-barrel domain